MQNAELYSRWLFEHGITNVPQPAEDGLFDRGTLQCLLPYLLAYWKPIGGADPSNGAPSWQSDTWVERAGGWTRFLRADQMLQWIAATCPPDQSPEAFTNALENALRIWLVPVDEPFARHRHVLDRRVETVRVFARGELLQWSRRPDLFPDAMREPVPGVDPVHTPENARAGLTRYLSDGWGISDTGCIVDGAAGGIWGPSSSRLAYRLHDAPRRVMLGASLQTRAISLEDAERPHTDSGNEPWAPSGRNLRVAFHAMDGWNHEDAIVLSESAAAKLTTCQSYTVRILVPAVVARLDLTPSGPVSAGDRLVRAFVDLFALGYRRPHARNLGADDGWLEITVPHSRIDQDARVLSVQRRRLHSLKWRELLIFHLVKTTPVCVGDKLATSHGIRGVVSAIRPDEEMPTNGSDKAEITLSPVGIAKRGAMGQFREADPDADRPSPAGTIFVVRQPQDALPRCRVRGRSPGRIRGQRYGEMEVWALMAHGARHIAAELLSFERSTARWMIEWESKLGSTDSRKLATRAVNRFLAVLGLEIRKGQFLIPEQRDGVSVVRKSAAAFDFPLTASGSDTKLFELLDDSTWFLQNGGLGAIVLDPPVTISLAEPDGESREVVFEALHVLPPWLRPRLTAKIRSPHHPITKSYAHLIAAIRGRWYPPTERELPRLLYRHTQVVLGDEFGAGAFLRREVLGRRLSRSARAVIVPRPDLRIDQIAIPSHVADQLFDGLPEENRNLVLVNRNPTLHRRGLLALRPVIDESGAPVFGLPLGVLHALAADFDGDQVCIVALETEQALQEAEGLVPGAETLRADPFRPSQPAFPLCKELASPGEESALACDTTTTPVDWCHKHAELVSRRICAVGDGWGSPITTNGLSDNRDLWDGLDEAAWLERADAEMKTVYLSVRKKGQLGGVLRRQLYRRPFTDFASFQRSVDAIHAITERLTQSALNVKAGAGAAAFPIKRFFANPGNPEAATWLWNLDPQLDHRLISEALGTGIEPSGVLAWLARPTFDTLLRLAEQHGPLSSNHVREEPRLTWFLQPH